MSQYIAVGSTTADLKKAYDNTVGVLTAAKEIVLDPALPEITKLVLELNSLEQKKPAASKPGAPSSPKASGIGLRYVVPPLRFYVRVRKQPLIGYAVVAALLAVPFMTGYAVGRRRR